MSIVWITKAELLAEVGLTAEELVWFEEQFREQMRLLSRPGEEGPLLYARDAILLLRGLAAMRSQGATADQIKGWFGLD